MSEDHSVADKTWARLRGCVAHPSKPFRASEIVGWFRRKNPDLKEQSLRAHIQVATSNASVESRAAAMFVNRQPLITRIEHGLYRPYDGDPEPVRQQSDRPRSRVMTQWTQDVNIEEAVGRYLRDRGPSARYT